MKELIERIEGAEGPSRELDAEIFNALAMAVHHEGGYTHFEIGGRIFHADCQPPRYTASLDAAMSLVPEGKEWTLDCLDPARDPRFGRCQARIMRLSYADDPEEMGPQAIANGSTPALALCAAALRAIGDTHDD